MLRALAVLLLVFEASWTALVTSGSPPADDLAVTLNKHVSNYNLGGLSLVSALIRVSNDFQIPMGITWVDSPAARAPLSLSWKDATVQKIIQAVAGTQSGYQVQVRNGVVHVSPMVPDDQNFLKIGIREFSVHNEYAEIAYLKLRMLLTPPSHGNRQISIAGPGDSKVTVELTNSSVEGVLDALGVVSSRKIWVVTLSGDARLTRGGLRRSISLWTDKPTDWEQPHWDVIRWGDPMPPGLTKN